MQLLNHARTGVRIRHVAGTALNAVLPARCPKCGAVTHAPSSVCSRCWASLSFIAGPLCHCCGAPFEFAVVDRTLCGTCLADPPIFARARAALRYDEESRGLLLRFKHGDGLHITNLFALWLALAGSELLSPDTVLAPIPLHWSRLFMRRYNQAAALSNALSVMVDIPVELDLLRRHRRTASQGRRTRAARERNVRNAFEISQGWRGALDGRSITLVDDVFTSGATASACARTLLRGGAARVDVLTVARVH